MDTKEITKRLNIIERRTLSKQELINEIAPVLGYAPSTIYQTFKFLIKNLLVVKYDTNKYSLYDKPIYYKKVERYYLDIKEYFNTVSKRNRGTSTKEEDKLRNILKEIALMQGYNVKLTLKKI